MRRPAPLPLELRLGPFHIDEAARAGVSRRRTRADDLVIPFRGIRASGPLDGWARIAAYAVRMPPGHVFSHQTAALLWGLPLPRGAPALHVAAPEPMREPRMRGVVGHRLGSGIPVDFAQGFPAVAPCDVWCQLAASLSLDELIAAGDRLVGWPQPLATITEVDRAIARFGARRGAIRLRAARREVRPGSASPRETGLRLALERAGFPSPEPNGVIELSGGGSTPGDLVFREWKVILEYDGEQHRTDERQFHRDVLRLDLLALDGWIVIRIGKRMTASDALGLLEHALRRRGWTP